MGWSPFHPGLNVSSGAWDLTHTLFFLAGLASGASPSQCVWLYQPQVFHQQQSEAGVLCEWPAQHWGAPDRGVPESSQDLAQTCIFTCPISIQNGRQTATIQVSTGWKELAYHIPISKGSGNFRVSSVLNPPAFCHPLQPSLNFCDTIWEMLMELNLLVTNQIRERPLGLRDHIFTW